MASHVEITSQEMVKPSSPTPPHLINYKLSYFDQIAQPIYMLLIFFYQPNQLDLPQLKQSLSNVLAQFYPLARRFSREDTFTIHCNDSGALFVESKVDINLLEVIKDLTMEEIEIYQPLGLMGRNHGMTETDTILLVVQLILFDSSGIAIAVQMHHKLSDGTSCISFMNAWAAASRGHDFSPPKLDMANLFPPKDISSFSSQISSGTVATENIVTKRLVFDKNELQKIKLESSSVIKNPTRVEAVFTFLLKHFREASRAKGSKKLLGSSHTVNLRPRIDPPLPDHALGNITGAAVAIPIPMNDDEGDVVGALRSAIRKVDGAYVGEEQLNLTKNIREMYVKEEIELVVFSSWSRFPVYGVDYGWGKPVWVTTTTIPLKNCVILMGTSCREGMEAWVNVLEKDAASMDFHFTN